MFSPDLIFTIYQWLLSLILQSQNKSSMTTTAPDSTLFWSSYHSTFQKRTSNVAVQIIRATGAHFPLCTDLPQR